MTRFSHADYEVDLDQQESSAAEVAPGGLLYRIASMAHWEKEYIVSGGGAKVGSLDGRFHRIDQGASYCANNFLLCISEVLYHMYRKVLDGIRDRHEPNHILASRTRDCRLVIFKVSGIDGLVYADSEAARSQYDSRITGSTVVFPDPTYEPLHTFSDALRRQKKRGVVYPSARHSVDLAFALFRDETESVGDFYEALDLSVSLVPETQDYTEPPQPCNLYRDKLHPTMGHFEFSDRREFDALDRRNILNPERTPSVGYIDFVRRRYLQYPSDACLPSTAQDRRQKNVSS